MQYKIMFGMKGFPICENADERMTAKQIMQELLKFNEVDVPQKNVEKILSNWPCSLHHLMSSKEEAKNEEQVCECSNFMSSVKEHYEKDKLRQYESFYYDLLIEKNSYDKFNIRFWMMNYERRNTAI
jgi:hypothetical protein